MSSLRRTLGQLVVTAVLVTGVAGAGITAAQATGPTLTRYPYLTDTVGQDATVNWATDSSQPSSLSWGPAGSCAANTMTATSTTITVGTKTEYQWKAQISGLGSGLTYCYTISQNSTSLIGTTTPSFTSAVAVGDTKPFTFAVLGDFGESTNGVNSHQTNLMAQLASSGAQFALGTGDTAYDTGTQTQYGDLQNTGGNSEVFGPTFWKGSGQSIPLFNALGNHGYNKTLLDVWPQARAVASSSGAYADDSASGDTQAWYAFDEGNVRIYVLDAASADSSYVTDANAHWKTTSPEYSWLKADLAAHPNALKMAAWHYPLSSDSYGASDTSLQGSTSLQGLLDQYGVKLAFTGHSHIYERNKPDATGMVTYITGGGGADTGPVDSCSAFDAYARGWVSSGSSCNGSVPTSEAQVHHFLKVSVNGFQVTVTPTDENGAVFDQQTYSFGAPAVACGAGQWTAQYYPNMTLTGTPVAIQCEDTINHNWGTTGPGVGGLGVSNYSVRWTQTATLTAGNYTYTMTGDDGIRMLLDGNTVLDGWRDQGPTTYTKTAPVSAGSHSTVVEYYQNTGGAVAKASYAPIAACGAGQWTAQYYPNMTLTGTPVAIQCEDTINHNWGTTGPGVGGLGVSNYSVRWTQTATLTAGNYTYTMTGDDGIRMLLDGNTVLDGWRDQGPTTYTKTAPVSAGSHSTVVEYYQNTGGAVAKASYAPIAACGAGQWTAQYYPNMTLTGTPVAIQCEDTINHNWGTTGPGVGGLGVSNYSVRWTQTATLTAGNYTYTMTGDDGIRMLLDGNTVLDGWRDQGPTTYTKTAPVSAGSHSTVVEYYQNTGGAVAKASYAPIAACGAGQWTAQYYPNMTLTGTPVAIQCEDTINHNWGTTGPGVGGLGVSNYSVRWTQTATLTAGNYTYTMTGDDGIRMLLDGNTVLDGWRDQGPTTYTKTAPVSAGSHSTVVEYYQNTGGAVAKASYAPA